MRRAAKLQDRNQSGPLTEVQSRPCRIPYRNLLALDDDSVMQAVQAQNPDALTVLFDRYYGVVMGTALRILRDRAEAEDVLQTVFLDVYEKAAQFDPLRGRFYTWMMNMAYSRSIKRKNYLTFRQFYGGVALDTLSDFQQGMMQLYTLPSHECSRFIHEALALLTEGQKRTIEMVHFEGLSLKDVAAQTEESFSNVRHHYYRGLAKLKVHLRSIRDDVRRSGSPAGDLEVHSVEA
jgi:RNA polymerase sigma-70 factor (ECF subfamily)